LISDVDIRQMSQSDYDADQQRMLDIIREYHNCCDNGNADAADQLKCQLEQIIESKFDDEKSSSVESNCEDDRRAG